jgi:hypothetical protein
MKEVFVSKAIDLALAENNLGLSRVEEPSHVEAGHPVLSGEEVDEALAGGALTPLCHPSVVAWSPLDETIKGPAFSSIEAHPDSDVFASLKIRGGTAEEEDISIISVESKETSLASIYIGRAIEEFVVFVEIAPALSAVVAEGYPSVSFAGMSAGVEIDRAIPQLYQTGLPGSIERKGGTLVPCLAVVIAINRVGVSFSFLMFIVVGHDPRGNKESSLVGAFSQCDAGVTGTIWDG